MSTPSLVAFDPVTTDPKLLVDRRELVETLVSELGDWLDLQPLPEHGRSWTVFGDKGVGKTILARHVLGRVLDRWRRQADANARPLLVVSVDCRDKARRRDVYRSVLATTLQALRTVAPQTTRDLAPAMDLVNVALEVSRWDTIELKQAHESVLQHSRAVTVKSDAADLLKLEYKLDLTRKATDLQTVQGLVRIDEEFLGQLVRALLQDLVRLGLRVLLHVDNVDELDHRDRTPADREQLRNQVEGLLVNLGRAPVALLVGIRTYYTGILGREFLLRHEVEPLPPGELRAALDQRLGTERDAARAHAATPAVLEATELLARWAPTPLAFLMLYQHAFNRGHLTPDGLRPGLLRFADTNFANLRKVRAFERLFPLFERADAFVSVQALSDVFDATTLQLLINQQVVLPQDFWDPVLYQLDPTLQVLWHASRPA